MAYTISSDVFDPEKCVGWLTEDTIRDPNIPTRATRANPCPCDFLQAIFDSRNRFDYIAYYSGIYKERVYCFVSRFPVSGLYQRYVCICTYSRTSLVRTRIIRNSG